MFPQIREQVTKKMKEDHQQAIRGRGNQIKAIQYENVSLQGEIRNARQTVMDLIENRHVLRRGVYDTVLLVVKKNKPEENGKSGQHPYYMIHCKKNSLNLTKKYFEGYISQYGSNRTRT